MGSPDEMKQKMLQSIEEKVGKTPDVIIEEIRKQNIEKHNQKIAFIKGNYGLSHGFANLLAQLSKKENAEDMDWLEHQYKGKTNLKGLYDSIIEQIQMWADLELAPKKSYVSLRTKKQFGIIQPSTKTRLDVGLNLKNSDVDLEPAGSFNSMVSHRIRIQKKEDLDKAFYNHLKVAYQLSLQ